MFEAKWVDKHKCGRNPLFLLIQIVKDVLQLFIKSAVDTMHLEILGKRRLNVPHHALKVLESVCVSFYEDEDDFALWPAPMVTSSFKNN